MVNLFLVGFCVISFILPEQSSHWSQLEKELGEVDCLPPLKKNAFLNNIIRCIPFG